MEVRVPLKRSRYVARNRVKIPIYLGKHIDTSNAKKPYHVCVCARGVNAGMRTFVNVKCMCFVNVGNAYISNNIG